MTARPSTRRRAGRSTGKPRPASVSAPSVRPRPMPTVSRPALRRSIVASSLARSAGLRRGRSTTAMPSRAVPVTAATWLSACRPSSSGVWAVRLPAGLSSVHRPVNPRASARMAYAASGRGSSPSRVCGSPTAKRGTGMIATLSGLGAAAAGVERTADNAYNCTSNYFESGPRMNSTAASTPRSTTGAALADGTRLGAAHLTVTDLDRSVAFYEQAVGLHVQRRERDAVALGAGGEDVVVLHEDPAARPAGR